MFDTHTRLPYVSLIDGGEARSFRLDRYRGTLRGSAPHPVGTAPEWHGESPEWPRAELASLLLDLAAVIDTEDRIDPVICEQLGWDASTARDSMLSRAEQELVMLAQQPESSPSHAAGREAVRAYRVDGTLPTPQHARVTYPPVTAPDGRYVVIHSGGESHPSMYRLEGHELLETVDVTSDRRPDWATASLVEVGRFSDIADLSAATYALCQEWAR